MKEQALVWLKSGSPAHYLQILGIVLYAHLEWFLPRTKIFKANSVLEGIGNMLKKVLVGRIPVIGKALTAMASLPKQEAVATVEEKPADVSGEMPAVAPRDDAAITTTVTTKVPK